jgi:polysaccharide biosynthesis/export protein
MTMHLFRTLALLLSFGLVACGGTPPPPPDATSLSAEDAAPSYVIAPLDSLAIFVWQAEDLSLSVPVRPDGRISIPLVEDMVAAGKTPSELARDLEVALEPYLQNPVVTIIVTSFGDTGGQTLQVVGEAQRPVSVPYRAGMTVLDLMVAVGGLTEFADGNRAVLVRGRGEQEQVYGLRLGDLLRRGDLSANRPVLPGDIVIVPKSLL